MEVRTMNDDIKEIKSMLRRIEDKISKMDPTKVIPLVEEICEDDKRQ